MVKIKTTNDDSSKNILVLKSNFEELLKTLKQTNELLSSKTASTKTTTTTKDDTNNKKALAKEIAQELSKNKSINEFRQIALGGITGISPALIEKLSIDKVIHTITKHSWNKVTGLFKSDKDNKIGSAIEANKQAPVTNRLDKIIGYLAFWKKNSTQQIGDKEKRESFLAKLGKFILLNIGTLGKIAAGVVLLRGISMAVRKIAERLHIDLDEEPETFAGAVGTGAKNVVEGAKKGAGIAKRSAVNQRKSISAIERSINDTIRWQEETGRFTPSERAFAYKADENIDALAKKKGMSTEQITRLKEARANLTGTNSYIKNNFTLEEQGRIGKAAESGIRKGKYTWVESLLPKTKNGVPITRMKGGLRALLGTTEGGIIASSLVGASKLLQLASIAGIALDAGISGYNYFNASTQKDEDKALGGFAARMAGAWGGAKIGGAIGALGGPSAWFTVPAGALIGGIGGLFGMDWLVNKGIDAKYDRLAAKGLYYSSKGSTFDLTNPAMQQWANQGFGFTTPIRKDEQIYEIDSTMNRTDLTADQKSPIEDVKTEAHNTNTILDRIYDLLAREFNPDSWWSQFRSNIDPKTGQAVDMSGNMNNIGVPSISYVLNKGR